MADINNAYPEGFRWLDDTDIGNDASTPPVVRVWRNGDWDPPVTKQPRAYQLEALEAIIRARGRFILGDEMGLGKTCPVYLAYRHFKFPAPALIVCGKNASLTWWKQAPMWRCPRPTLIRHNNPEKRKQMWATYGGNPHKFVCVTRETLKADVKRGWVPQHWELVIADEAHRDTNRKTGNYRVMKWLKSKGFIFVTGSPMKRGPQNLWALLNVLYPQKFTSYWRFCEKYLHVIKNEWGGWEIIGPKNLHQLTAELKDIMLVRSKKEVAPWLPPKQRHLDHVLEMVPEQRRIYEQLNEEMLAELTDDTVTVASTVLARIMRQRQLLCTPRILDPRLEDGACLDHLIEMLDDASDTHMVVFSPFKAAFPFVRARLIREGFDPDTIFQLQGGTSLEDLKRITDEFARTRGIMLCTIQFAESFDLTPATWCYFLGYEWDPNANLQAEDRLHRMTVTRPVDCYYPHHRGCIDQEFILDALNTKSNSIRRVLNSVRELRESIRRQKELITQGG